MILKSHGKSKLAQEAFDAGLFIKGWHMQDHLQQMINGRTPNNIVVAYTDQHKAVGCLISVPVFIRSPDRRYTKNVVYRETEKTIVMFYVLPRFRRQGIGKHMFVHWKQKHGCDNLLGLQGKKGSLNFFQHCRVPTKLRYIKPQKPLKSMLQLSGDQI